MYVYTKVGRVFCSQLAFSGFASVFHWNEFDLLFFLMVHFSSHIFAFILLLFNCMPVYYYYLIGYYVEIFLQFCMAGVG